MSLSIHGPYQSLSDVAFVMPKSGQHKSATAVIPPNAACDLRLAAKRTAAEISFINNFEGVRRTLNES